LPHPTAILGLNLKSKGARPEEVPAEKYGAFQSEEIILKRRIVNLTTIYQEKSHSNDLKPEKVKNCCGSNIPG